MNIIKLIIWLCKGFDLYIIKSINFIELLEKNQFVKNAEKISNLNVNYKNINSKWFKFSKKKVILKLNSKKIFDQYIIKNL